MATLFSISKKALNNIFFCLCSCFQYNAFERTIVYAISLGGDTDTIATMAGAIAGAYHGIDLIPPKWSSACEGLQDALNMANSLHKIGFQKEEAV